MKRRPLPVPMPPPMRPAPLTAAAAPRPVTSPTPPAPAGGKSERWSVLLTLLLCASGCVWLLGEVSALDDVSAQRVGQLQRLQAMVQDRRLALGPVPALDGLFPDHRVVVVATPAGNLLTVVPADGGEAR